MKKIIGLFLYLLVFVSASDSAENFVRASSMYGTSSTVEITSAPFSWCLRFKTSTTATFMGMVSLAQNSSGGTNAFLQTDNTTTINHCVRPSGGSFACAVATTTYSTGAWNSVCGVEASTTSRAVYYNGGNKGTDTTSVSLTSLQLTGIGAVVRDTIASAFNGDIAEVGIWNVALTDDEAVTYSKGYVPPCIRPDKLVAYYPLVNDSSTAKDFWDGPSGANNLTWTNSPTVSDHPYVIHCQ